MATIPAASPKPETGLRYLNSSEPINMPILSTRLFRITILIALLGTALYWLLAETDTPSEMDWDADRRNLPEISALQQRIEADLFGEQTAATETMGADIDEVIDRSAMEAKLEGLTKNVTTRRQPTEAELNAFYAQHKAQYRESSRYSFTQVIFTNAKHGGLARQMAKQALHQTRQTGIEPKGDKTPLAERYFSATSVRVDREFGNNFAQKLFNLVKDGDLPCWIGPIASSQGVHLVCIQNASLGTIPDLDEVRSQVINDWRFSVSTEE